MSAESGDHARRFDRGFLAVRDGPGHRSLASASLVISKLMCSAVPYSSFRIDPSSASAKPPSSNISRPGTKLEIVAELQEACYF